MYYHGSYMEKPVLPSGKGCKAVGTVTTVGTGVDASLVGHRFGTIPGFSMNRYPVLAETAVVPAGVLAAVPESLSAAQGAAIWMQYCTAYGALVPFGKVSHGDFVVITAASSSVGLAAIQIVKAEGGTSIAATRTAGKKAKLLELGADHVVVTDEENLVARVTEITGGKGARIVFDPIGGDAVNALAQATANGGTIFLYGMLSGQSTPFPMAAFGQRIAMLDTPSMGPVTRHRRGPPDPLYLRSPCRRFVPTADRPQLPFAQTVEAYRYLESNQQIGKVIITL